jgi:hypothetical protein
MRENMRNSESSPLMFTIRRTKRIEVCDAVVSVVQSNPLNCRCVSELIRNRRVVGEKFVHLDTIVHVIP